MRISDVVLFVGVLLMAVCGGASAQDGYLQGVAEGLWNEKIDLGEYNEGVTIINPFSPSNCGWCMFDGEFMRENYCRNAVERGDAFFGMCLFNPQRDIYTFQKHYRESAEVLTAPLSLHGNYHRDGFPWLTAVKDGEVIHQGSAAPYNILFDSLSPLLWPKDPPATRPASPLQMADKFCCENDNLAGVRVIADSDTVSMIRMSEGIERVKQRYKDRGWSYHLSYEVKYERDVSQIDLQKSIQFSDATGSLGFDALGGCETPVKISNDLITIGEFSFPRQEVFVRACFPNPHNPESFIEVKCTGSKVKRWASMNHVDYYVSRNTNEGEVEVLLQGCFDKSDEKWSFNPRLAVMSPSIKKYCSENFCPLPNEFARTLIQNGKTFVVPRWVGAHTPFGRLYATGSKGARFPRVASDEDGVCWITWEQEGDILLSSVVEGTVPEFHAIEDDLSDSFDPQVAVVGKDVWVFYLNDIGYYYRLYGRSLSDGRLSTEVPISDREACDAITPAVASDRVGKMAISWTEWRANNKFPKYRTMKDRVLGEIKSVQHRVAESEPTYVCAWCPSLAIDKTGNVRGAWNQHYPATFAAYSGNLTDEPTEIAEGNIGGYPTVVFDDNNRFWVFWETYLWNKVFRGEPQAIQAAFFDEKQQRFSIPVTISDETQTVFNQTPCAATGPDGTMWVAWSGRLEEGEPWGVYLVNGDGDSWSDPVRVSPDGEHSRAPSIAVSDDNVVWLAWHSGVGDDMEIKVLRYEPR